MLKRLKAKTRRFLFNEDGPTTVEYAVLLMMLVLTFITAIQIIARESAASFNDTANGIYDVVKD